MLRANWVDAASVVLVGALALLVLLWPANDGQALIGHPAPGFSLPDYQNEGEVSLAELHGKVVLVNFWATWCSVCRDEIPDLIAVERKLRAKGFEIVGIALDPGGPRDVIPFVDEAGINYAVALGVGDITKQYSVHALPSSFLLDRGGRVRRVFPGTLDALTLEGAVAPLL